MLPLAKKKAKSKRETSWKKSWKKECPKVSRATKSFENEVTKSFIIDLGTHDVESFLSLNLPE